MEFELTFSQSRSLMRRVLLRQILILPLASAVLLYFSYIGAQVADYYWSEDPTQLPSITFRMWYVLSFALIIVLILLGNLPRTLRRHFRGRMEISVHIKCTDQGYTIDTDLGNGFLKWAAVRRTKRTNLAFVLDHEPGELMIPMDVISHEQMTLIETRVREANEAA